MVQAIMLIISLIMMIVMIRKADTDLPPTEGSIEFNQYSETNSIPVLWGHDIAKDAQIIMDVGFRESRIKQDVLFGSEIVAYKQYKSIGFCLGWGSEKPGKCRLHEIWIGEKLAWKSDNPNGDGSRSININHRKFWDSHSRWDNGIAGEVQFYDGSQTTGDSYMTGFLKDSVMPSYHGLAVVYFKNFYWGNTKQGPKVEFVYSRYDDELAPEYAKIGKTNNPVEILYNALTNKVYGQSKTAAEIDVNNFRYVAKELYNEGLGLSIRTKRDMTFEQLKKDVEKHAAIIFYQDVEDNKHKIKLLRDYKNEAPDGVLDLNESNVKEMTLEQPMISDLATEFKLKFRDGSEKFKQKIAMATNNAMYFMNGQQKVVHEGDFYGFTEGGLAQKIASRELRFVTNQVKTVDALCNTESIRLNIGDLVNFSWKKTDLGESLFRVRELVVGKLDIRGGISVRLKLIEDYFSMSKPAMLDPITSNDYLTEGQAYLQHHLAVEAPKAFGTHDVFFMANLPFSSARALTNINEDGSDGQTTTEFTPFFFLKNDIDQYTPGFFTFSDMFYFDSDNYNHIDFSDHDDFFLDKEPTIGYIEDGENSEFIFVARYVNPVVGQDLKYYIIRGCYNSFPKPHPAGCKVWLLSRGFIKKSFGEAGTYGYGLKYKTYSGFEAAITENQTIEITNQSLSPYPPRSVKIYGNSGEYEYEPEYFSGVFKIFFHFAEGEEDAEKYYYFTTGWKYQHPAYLKPKLKLFDDNDNLITENFIEHNSAFVEVNDDIDQLNGYLGKIKIELSIVDERNNYESKVYKHELIRTGLT